MCVRKARGFFYIGSSFSRNRFFVTSWWILLAIVFAIVGCAPPVPTTSSVAVTPVPTMAEANSPADRSIPNFSHVFIIVMENREYDDVIGSPDAPYLNQLAATYALATRYYAVRHPSLPNYLALISGSTQGMTDDCATCTVDGANLVGQLEAHHKTWTAYMEDYPGSCFNGTVAGGPLAWIGQDGYVRRHDPFIYFDNIRENPDRCRQIVPLSQFESDLAGNRLSDFVWITPNLRHDMHSGSTRAGDDWLASFVPKILQSSAWKSNGVLFIVWDEGRSNQGCCADVVGGHVPALVIAAKGVRGYRSDVPYSHYSLLRTIEDAWHLGYLGYAGDPRTTPMNDFFGERGASLRRLGRSSSSPTRRTVISSSTPRG